MKESVRRRIAAGLLAAACLLALVVPAAAEGEGTTADLTGGLAGYWTFDGADETARLTNQAADSAITAGTSGSGVSTKADGGIDGGSVYFTGAASSPLKLNLTEVGQGLNVAAADFTLAAWVKYDADMSMADNSNLFQQTGNGRTLLYVKKSTGEYGTYIAAANVPMSTAAPVAEKWHHVVLTWDHAAKTMTCYVNGRQEVSQALTGSPADAATDVWIGCHKSSAGQEIKGHVDELRYYTRALSGEEAAALYAYNGYNEIAEREPELNITVKPGQKVRDITPAMFGINHRYHKNGYGTWDAAAEAVNAGFNALVKGSFGSIRWPGGTVSNLFTWKDSIGPMNERTPTIAGNNFYSEAGEAPVQPGFGLDEAAEWICDDLGVEMIYVYGMGRGSAQDAADLVEYLNAPNDGSNPGGGTNWAAVRAANGHPEPYGVTKFEIGNEFTDVGQNYWATPRGNNANQAVEDYIMGGRRDFAGETQYYQHNDRVVKKGDWRADASLSDGNPGEERYLCYVPVIAGSATIYVDGEEWEIVETLEGQGAANVCTLDYETGKITFGDGTNGNIPPQGQRITAHYSSNRDGFVAYYNAMQAVAADIPGLDIKIYSGVHDALQSSFITKMHEKGYDDKYDGVIYHPYTGTAYNESSFNDCLTQARAFAATIGSLKRQMDTTSGYTDKEVAVSEFGINRTDEFTKSLGNAIYTANHMIDCVDQGAAYQNRHCLVDFTQGDNLGAWTQCVIQCLGSASSAVSENQYVSTPSARVFSIFNSMTGNTQVAYEAEGNDNYHTSNGQSVQKLNLYTTKDAEGNVYVLAVNNQLNKDQEVHIAVEGEDLTGRMVQVRTLTSDSVMDQNTPSEPDKVRVAASTAAADGAALTYTLPAHSVVSLKIPAAEKADPLTLTAEPASLSGGGKVYLEVTVPEEARDAVWDGLDLLGNISPHLSLVCSDPSIQSMLTTYNFSRRTIGFSATLPNVTKTYTFTATLLENETAGYGEETATCTVSVTKEGGGSSTPSYGSGSAAPAEITKTETKPDGTKVTTVTRPDGTVTETVTTPEGAKTEKVTTPDKAVTITATAADGWEMAKVEIPATIPAPETEFEDLDTVPWAREAVNNVAALELVKGVGGSKYDPAAPMTRGSLATVLYRLSNGKADGLTCEFADVDWEGWSAAGITWAARADIVKGVDGAGQKLFWPNDSITREQLAVMLARYAKLIGMDVKAYASKVSAFADGSETGSWAVDGVAWCVENGILKGKGGNALDPTANVTRAEVAVMLDRFLNLVKYAE